MRFRPAAPESAVPFPSGRKPMLEQIVFATTLAINPPPTTVRQIFSAERIAAHSPLALDTSGWQPSLYRGQWFTAKAAPVRRCIIARESHANYRAANKTSSARGAYQFLDRSWRQGLVWMFLKESRSTHDGLEAEELALRTQPISKWSRYWQDRAFYTAWRFGKGSAHWKATVPGTGC